MHIGDTGQMGQIKDSLMGLPVASYQSCTVDGKYHRQVLDTDIVQHLIIRSLQNDEYTAKIGRMPPAASPAAKVTA